MDINTLTIGGNVSTLIDQDCLHKTKDGRFVINFSIASQKENSNGADYIRCTAFGRTAEVIATYVKQGSHVIIEGRLCSDTYEKDGHTNYTMYVLVKKIDFRGNN